MKKCSYFNTLSNRDRIPLKYPIPKQLTKIDYGKYQSRDF